ncbi:CAP domain-containing protein [Actinoplanes sp. NPDC049316]|uniref:CAP domain-containing protein n=1 Tax=Actinoplanes sp. NPDC049316 TaxID=3154727 RepID=UPI00342E0E61
MRKPAVVVAVAVSAVLAGGIMVATSAGAETTPDQPGVPSVAGPDLSALPDLPSGAVAVPDAAEPGDPGEPAAGPAPARPGGPVTASPAAGDPKPADGGPKPADGPKPARPAANDPSPDASPSRTPAKQPGTVADAHRDVTASQALSSDPRGDVQQQARDLVNRERRRAGCDDVTVDRRLIAAANRHAADMARRGYFAHEDPNGDRAGERVADAGYQWSRFGENIARGQDSVYEVVDGWMNSPEHRENILDCRLHQVGVGLAFSADRTPYWVQDFATPQ